MNTNESRYGGNYAATLSRDNYTCQDCGATQPPSLVVRRLDGSNRNDPNRDNSLSNLSTLCRPCNVRRNNKWIGISTEIKFWTFVNKSQDCWIWNGLTNKSGYGRFIVSKKEIVLAHRYSWELSNDKCAHLNVLHHCDNPGCVNPSHLYEGTPLDNHNDMIRRGRKCVDNVRLSGDKVREIRSSSKTQMELAALYGVSQTLISQVITRQAWSHIS